MACSPKQTSEKQSWHRTWSPQHVLRRNTSLDEHMHMTRARIACEFISQGQNQFTDLYRHSANIVAQAGHCAGSELQQAGPNTTLCAAAKRATARTTIKVKDDLLNTKAKSV